MLKPVIHGAPPVPWSTPRRPEPRTTETQRSQSRWRTGAAAEPESPPTAPDAAYRWSRWAGVATEPGLTLVVVHAVLRQLQTLRWLMLSSNSDIPSPVCWCLHRLALGVLKQSIATSPRGGKHSLTAMQDHPADVAGLETCAAILSSHLPSPARCRANHSQCCQPQIPCRNHVTLWVSATFDPQTACKATGPNASRFANAVRLWPEKPEQKPPNGQPSGPAMPWRTLCRNRPRWTELLPPPSGPLHWSQRTCGVHLHQRRRQSTQAPC
mmetsp:Transcript_12056/g.26833  ORF Transcript_12056/g.26833 Transcript_12056/m.26833 type:complete len:268 (+) Transcript_12056:2328-3131(+)